MWSSHQKTIMSLDEKNNLKIIGKNQEDLKVISAYLQDSIVVVKDMVFLKQNRIFVIIVNRYMWEDIEKGVFRKHKRTRCALRFGEVIEVKSQNIKQKNRNKILECLAIKCRLFSDENYEIKIFFSGNSLITIMTETIDVVVHDLGRPWNVKHAPLHKI